MEPDYIWWSTRLWSAASLGIHVDLHLDLIMMDFLIGPGDLVTVPEPEFA